MISRFFIMFVIVISMTCSLFAGNSRISFGAGYSLFFDFQALNQKIATLNNGLYNGVAEAESIGGWGTAQPYSGFRSGLSGYISYSWSDSFESPGIFPSVVLFIADSANPGKMTLSHTNVTVELAVDLDLIMIGLGIGGDFILSDFFTIVAGAGPQLGFLTAHITVSESWFGMSPEVVRERDTSAEMFGFNYYAGIRANIGPAKAPLFTLEALYRDVWMWDDTMFLSRSPSAYLSMVFTFGG